MFYFSQNVKPKELFNKTKALKGFCNKHQNQSITILKHVKTTIVKMQLLHAEDNVYQQNTISDTNEKDESGDVFLQQ